MNRNVITLVLLTALATACASSTQEETPEPAPITRAATPAPAPAPMPEPVPAAMDETVAQETVVVLPDTASQAPTLALAGVSAMAIAGLVGVVRRRLF